MFAKIIRTIVFTQIISFNSYLDNMGKPHLNLETDNCVFTSHIQLGVLLMQN